MRILSVLIVSLLSASCITQTTTVCADALGAPSPWTEGEIYVVPTWASATDLETYMRWERHHPGDKRGFEDELKETVREAFSDQFPVVELEAWHARYGLALGLIDSDGDIFSLVSGNKELEPLLRALEGIGDRLEEAVQDAAPYLTIRNEGGEIALREVTYIDKGDVTYCVYGVNAFSGIVPTAWSAEHRREFLDDDGMPANETVTAHLSIYVVVAEV